MGYFQVSYDSRGVNYDHRGFIRLATVYLHVRHLPKGTSYRIYHASNVSSLSSPNVVYSVAGDSAT